MSRRRKRLGNKAKKAGECGGLRYKNGEEDN